MNWSEFFYMGGYASYVWFSYGLTTLLFIVSWVVPVMKHKAVLKKLSRRLKSKE